MQLDARVSRPAFRSPFWEISAGGALYLVIGVLAAILEARTSGRGQVIDAAIIDGVASMATNVYGLYAGGLWPRKRGENALDSGSHFYEVYECQDGLWVSVGPIEERFYTQFLSLLGIDPESIGPQHDPDSWPLAKQLIAEKFKSRPREYWCDLLEGTDACFAPVLLFDEAPNHPHIRERGVFIEIDGIMQPAPAPRFSRTAPAAPKAPQESPQRDIDAVMAEWKSAAQA